MGELGKGIVKPDTERIILVDARAVTSVITERFGATPLIFDKREEER